MSISQTSFDAICVDAAAGCASWAGADEPPPNMALDAAPTAWRAMAEPEPKRPKVDPRTGLMSEADFSDTLGGDKTVSVSVKCPLDDSNPAWQLLGQTVVVDVDCGDSIKALKTKLRDALGGMPENKQQLKHDRLGFLKDALSLAHFNIRSGDVVELVVRSRGRR